MPALQIDEDFARLDPHLEPRLRDGAACLVPAGADVELPAVPRTSHDRPAQAPARQRSALVRTDAVQGIKRAVDMKQSHDAITRHALDRLSRRAFFDSRDADPICHRVSSSWAACLSSGGAATNIVRANGG